MPIREREREGKPSTRRTQKLVVVLFSLVVMFGVVAQAHAATYYVDNCVVTGNDINNGTSSSTPWLTVAKVNSSTFSPGDSILFERGCTWREQMTVPSSGNASSSITFGAYGNGTTTLPIISGADVITGFTLSSQEPVLDLTDNFNRANANPIGGNWTTVTNEGNMKISSNTLVSAANTSGLWGIYWNANTFGNDQYSQIQDVTAAIHGGWALLVRVSASAETYYKVSVTATNLQLYSVSAGTATFITSFAHTYAQNDTFKLTVAGQDAAAVLSVYANGTLLGTANGVSGINSGSAGVNENFGGDFLDNWAGGNVLGGPVYQAALTTQPKTVAYNGAALTYNHVGTALGTNQWDWAANILYVNVGGDPSGGTVEVGQRAYAISVNHLSYLTFQDLTLTGANTHTLYLLANSGSLHDIIVQRNTILNTYQGVFATGSGVTGNLSYLGNTVHDTNEYGLFINDSLNGSGNLMDGNTVYNVGQPNKGADTNENCIYVQTAGVIIQNNLLYNCGNVLSLDAGTHEHGIYYQTGAGYVIRYNVIHDVTGGGVKTGGATGANIYSNILYHNGLAGVSIDNAGSPSNLNIYNNVMYANGGGEYGAGGFSIQAGSTNVNFKNNILFDNTAGGDTFPYLPQQALQIVSAGTNTGFVADYNLMFSDASPPNYVKYAGAKYTWSGWQGLGYDTHGVNAAPTFTNATSGIFTLLSGSPAIDAGTNLGSTYQLALASSSTWPSGVVTLNQNSYGAGWDMGAYVYTQTSTPSIAMTAPTASSTVSGTVTVSASSTAVSPAAISSVQFYLDGSPLGSPVTSTSSPNTYSYSWNTASSTNASHTLYALATDNYGNATTSAFVTVTVSNAIAPTPAPVSSGGGGSAYDLAINGGAATTPTPSVALSLYGTAAYTMEVSNTSTFAGATWIPYATTMPWTLTPNLGPETVYAQFKAVGGTIVGSAQASIDLVSAGTSVSTSSSLADQLKALQAELAALQAQANQQAVSSSTHFSFTRNLSLWSIGNDVKQLQAFLISENRGSAAAKLAKHGTTNVFGMLTFNALMELQRKTGITPTSGYFGPKTRAYVEGRE